MAQSDTSKRRFAINANIALLRLTQHWLTVAIIILGTYVSLPVIAPTLMRLGLTGPAEIIYTIYMPFCHQYAFRSVFLYGEQPMYPRYNVDTPLRSFESYVEDMPEFAEDAHVTFLGETMLVGNIYDYSTGYQLATRQFRGNDQMGYKTTLCARDMAIYSMMLVGALIYSRVRHRLRPVPLWLYFILGIMPIGIDGFSQLLSYPPFEFWPARETLPVFRIMTGAIFGLMNAWLGFPYIEEAMRDTYNEVAKKLQKAGIEY